MPTVPWNPDPDFMRRTFELVCPRKQAERKFARGEISQEALDKAHWKGRICITVTDAEMAEAGVTRTDIEDAIVFMTGSVASVYPKKDGITFVAAGYLEAIVS